MQHLSFADLSAHDSGTGLSKKARNITPRWQSDFVLTFLVSANLRTHGRARASCPSIKTSVTDLLDPRFREKLVWQNRRGPWHPNISAYMRIANHLDQQSAKM